MRPLMLLLLAAAPAGADPAADPGAPQYGEPTTFTARYVVDPLPGGKRLQAVTLVREDGEVWIRAYRPVPSEYRFADRKVVVTGRPYWPPPGVQAVGGTHFEPQSIELAPGETPHGGPPDVMPAPPEVTTRAQAEARSGLWVRAFGRLEAAKGAGGGTLTFGDGSTLPVLTADPGDVEALAGQEVTITAQVRSGPAPALWGHQAVCAGRAARCGLEAQRLAPKPR